MARAHGKDTFVSVNGNDLSVYTKTSTFEKNPDIHETTGYRTDDATYRGGIRRGTFTMGGNYDIEVGGPGNILRPLEGTTAPIIRQIAGPGSGLPQDSFSAVLGKYTETAPVDDLVSWSLDTTITGPVVPTTQP